MCALYRSWKQDRYFSCRVHNSCSTIFEKWLTNERAAKLVYITHNSKLMDEKKESKPKTLNSKPIKNQEILDQESDSDVDGSVEEPNDQDSSARGSELIN